MPEPVRPSRHSGAALACCVASVLALLATGAARTAGEARDAGAARAADASPVDAAAREAAATPPAAGAPEESAVPVEVHAKAEPNTVTIGTPFRYTVEVAVAPGVEVVLSQPSERIGGFDIVDFGDAPPAERDGKTVVSRWYRLVGYSAGDHLVRSAPVHYRRPGEDLTEAPADEILVSVESVLARAGDAIDIRDIKGPEAPPFNWRPYYLAGAVLAALLLLGFVLYRALNRPRRAMGAPAPRPAHEIAHDALLRLRYRKLIEQGAFKEYYSILSAIVRTYLEQRFELRAPEMTSEEFLTRSARDGRLRSAHRALLGEFLTEADLVKFARHLPTIADSERAYAAAKRFVDETAAGTAASVADARAPAGPRPAPREERRAAG